MKDRKAVVVRGPVGVAGRWAEIAKVSSKWWRDGVEIGRMIYEAKEAGDFGSYDNLSDALKAREHRIGRSHGYALAGMWYEFIIVQKVKPERLIEMVERIGITDVLEMAKISKHVPEAVPELLEHAENSRPEDFHSEIGKIELAHGMVGGSKPSTNLFMSLKDRLERLGCVADKYELVRSDLEAALNRAGPDDIVVVAFHVIESRRPKTEK